MPTHQRANLAVFNAGRDGMHQAGIPLRGQAHGQAHPNGRIGIGGPGVKQGFAAQNADTFARCEGAAHPVGIDRCHGDIDHLIDSLFSER